MYPADLASEDQCCNKSNSNGHAWLYGRPEDISHGYQRAVFYPQNHRHEREHHRDGETHCHALRSVSKTEAVAEDNHRAEHQRNMKKPPCLASCHH